jgi:predicted Zn finger-like uncharacterized protein
MNNTCPQCQAVYNVQSKDVGRRIACKKCGARLVVDPTGLVYDTGGSATATPGVAVAQPADDDDLGSLAPTPRPRRGGGGMMAGFSLIDVPTWLLGAGAFLVIVFLFRPLIDQAIVASTDAERERITLNEDIARETFEKQEKKSETEIKARNDAAKKAADSLKEVQQDVSRARIDAKQNSTWNLRGMTLGFLLLAVASIGYLSSPNPGIRRTVGAILLVSQLVLIFTVFTFGGAAAGLVRSFG